MEESQNIRPTFRIICEGTWRLRELVARGAYEIVPPEYAEYEIYDPTTREHRHIKTSLLTEDRVPIQRHPSIQRTIELVLVSGAVISVDAVTKLERFGLARPTCEDVLYFGIQHPDEQRKHRIAFLAEEVLQLDEFGGGRRLCLLYFDYKWDPGTLFAGIRV